MQNYTELSQKAYDLAIAPGMSSRQAAEWLMNAASFQTLPEKLFKFYPGTPDDLQRLLRDELYRSHPDANERDSIRKNVRNWFTVAKGIDDRTISRPYALEICFILRLTLERADQLMKAVAGMGIHYRSPIEFVAAYALDNGLTYSQYVELLGQLSTEGLLELSDGAVSESFTPVVAAAVRMLHSVPELKRYLRENRGDFSAAHNTAHAFLTDMLDVLQNEGTDATVGELIERNLYRRFVARHSQLSALEKSIRNGWPDESQISRMRTREIPVGRKTLILLYLASGGGLSVKAPQTDAACDGDTAYDDFDYDDYGDADISAGDADFDAIRIQLDAMLTDCGYAPLNPRQPFDWMVLFGIATGDLFDLDERFETLLGELFGNAPQARPSRQL